MPFIRTSFRVPLDAADKLILRRAIQNEIAYHNAVVAGLGSRLRSTPDAVLGLTGPLEALYVDLAVAGIPARSLLRRPVPAALDRHKTTIADLTEGTALLLETAVSQTGVCKETKRAIALEVLRFMRAQAATLAAPLNRDDQSYRAPAEILQPADPRRKRHIQIPRAGLDLKPIQRDDKTIATDVGLPYGVRRVRIEEDLTKGDWTMLIIKDEDVPTGPWLFEFRKEAASYLLKLSDPPVRRGPVSRPRPAA